MKTLQISDRTHNRLLEQVQNFGETAEDVIRRLLEQADGKSGDGDWEGDSRSPSSGSPLVSKGGRLPHGAKLRATYKGTQYVAQVRDGKLYWDGEGFDSPSAAALAVIHSTGTARPTENGWRFWAEVQLPNEEKWRPMSEVRDAYSK